ncbi:MAG: VOC family protein [Cyanobacteria bacterium P01_F01_bin.33]
MKFGYAIVYVDNVNVSVEFYKQAFGIPTRFVHESGDYAELETGVTTLAFASHQLGASNFPDGYTKLTDLDAPAGIEIALVTEDVSTAVLSAIDAGARCIAEPSQKPWGQTVAHVRAPDGMLIELCTPVSVSD